MDQPDDLGIELLCLRRDHELDGVAWLREHRYGVTEEFVSLGHAGPFCYAGCINRRFRSSVEKT